MKFAAGLLFITASLSCSGVRAGALADFEQDVASQQNSKAESQKATQKSNSNSCKNGSFLDAIFCSLLDDMLFGGNQISTDASDATMQTDDVFTLGIDRAMDYSSREGAREKGDVLIPFVRLNLNLQDAKHGVRAADFNLELGHGGIGAELRTTHFSDDTHGEKLDNYQLQFLFRNLISNNIQLNFGIGRARLNGVDTYVGDVFSMPILIKFNDSVALVLKPAIQEAGDADINDNDVSLLLTHRKLAFRIGYRSFKSPNERIEGPYLGFDMIY